MEQVQRLEVHKFIDEQPFSRFQVLVIALCSAVLWMDGFDAQAMGFVAPALVKDLNISRAVLGPVFSSGLFGIMIGALIFGPIADKIGRKPVLVFCTLVFGIFSLLTATANTVQTLVIYRLITGFGLGGAMPNAIALTSEFMPKRFRATAVMIMFCGFSVGAAVGGFAAAGLIARFGWQGVFFTGGVVPLVIAVFLIALLPESIRFLLLKGGSEDRVTKYLARISPHAKALQGVSFAIDEEKKGGFVVKQLFANGRTPITLLLWVIFFMSLLDLYFLNNWLPTLMADNGIKVQTAILITTMFQIGGTMGALTLGRFIDKYLSFRVLGWVYLAAAASVFLIASAGASVILLTCIITVAGFFVVGGQTSSNAIAAENYPTAIRSTGVGWALGIGRIGSIVGPTLGGALLTSPDQAQHIFWAAAIPMVIGSTAAFTAAAVQRRSALRS